MRKRPSLAFVSPSRPRRNISRAVAPTPPARKKPTPSAPTATAGRLARNLAPMLVASPISSRSVSAAPASCSRSDSMSRRTSSSVRLLLPAIGLQRVRRQLRLADGLLPERRRPLLDLHHADRCDEQCKQEQDAGGDQEREPRRHGGCVGGRERPERGAQHAER